MTSGTLKAAAAVLVLALAAAIGWRWMSARPVQPPVAAPPVVLEVPADEILPVRRVDLQRSVDFSGSVKATRSAFVKARMAAELRELTVREGDSVRAGQLLVRQDPTEFEWRLRQAEQQARSAQAQLEIAQRTLANNRALVAQGFISPTALESSISNEAAAQANLQAALAAVEIARKSLGDTTLSAPMDGIVSQRLAQPGERVGVDARILEIVDLSRLEIEAALAAEDVAQVRIGQVARVQIDGMELQIGARVARINPSAQAGSRTVPVYLALDAHPALRQGLFARGRIELERSSALATSLSAVRVDRPQPYLLVLEGEVVRSRTVRLGRRGQERAGAAELVEILDGVPEGAQVLSGSLGTLADGARWKRSAVPAAASGAPAAQASARAASAAR
jgi:membrane fusion protein, multidrug efflux system